MIWNREFGTTYNQTDCSGYGQRKGGEAALGGYTGIVILESYFIATFTGTGMVS